MQRDDVTERRVHHGTPLRRNGGGRARTPRITRIRAKSGHLRGRFSRVAARGGLNVGSPLVGMPFPNESGTTSAGPCTDGRARNPMKPLTFPRLDSPLARSSRRLLAALISPAFALSLPAQTAAPTPPSPAELQLASGFAILSAPAQSSRTRCTVTALPGCGLRTRSYFLTTIIPFMPVRKWPGKLQRNG